MSDVIIPTRFQWRRDTAANWAANNPIPRDGEPCLVTDAVWPISGLPMWKLGDGATAWNSLPYAVPDTSSASAGDPFRGQTGSLLHFNGTDGSTTFTDVRGKTWTAVGNAQLDTAQSKFGGASLLLDGTGDYISTSSADLDVHQTDFTIEAWIRLNSLAATNGIFFNGSLAADANRLQLLVTTSGALQLFISPSSGTGVTVNSAATLSTATWYHVAGTRRGNILRVFVDGVMSGSAAYALNNGADSNAYIGTSRAGGASTSFNGWIDDFRLTNGVARYTVDFTPPTAAFPDN